MNEGKFIHACSICRDTGWVMAESVQYKTNYAFRCGVCGAAERLQLSTKSIPLWSSVYKKDFRRLNAQGADQ